jgi:hypothetical protein
MHQCENEHMDRVGLPHGAKGIESDDFAIEFRGDKIVFVPKSHGAGNHYTVHAGPKSGVIDLHETHPGADGREQHRTLFAMRRDDLAALLGEAAPRLPDFLRLFRPLTVGWMKHRNIGIARGIDPVSGDEIAAVTQKHKRRLRLDPERYERNIFVPEFLDEVYDFPDGTFSLFHRGRNIGIGFKKTDQEGNVRLFWIKRRDLASFGNEWRKKVGAAIERLAIPRDRYGEFPILRA